MAILGELLSLNLSGAACACGQQPRLQLCQSPAGYYLGCQCPHCGAVSRQTGAYASQDEAQARRKKPLLARLRITP